MPNLRASFLSLCLSLTFSKAHSTNTTKVAVCPVATERSNQTRIDSDDPFRRYTEISGMCISTHHTYNGAPIMYALADIGDGARFGAWDSVSGKRLLTWKLPDVDGISNVDWESMDIGTCGGKHVHKQCLYIVDAGDNVARSSGGSRSGRSSTYKIIRIMEPNYTEFSDNDELDLAAISVLPFEYTDRSAPTQFADSEASFIDHTGWGGGNVGDFHIITKWDSSNREKIRIFRFPPNVWPEFGNISSVPYAPAALDISDNADDLMRASWTRAGMSFDGTVIALGDTQRAHLFLRCPGQNITDVLSSDACYTWSNPSRGQVETFAWTQDGKTNFQVPEGDSPAIGVTKMNYEVSRAKKVCPSVGYDETGICRNQGDCSALPDAWCKEGAAFYNDPSILLPIPCGATRSDFVVPPSMPATASPTEDATLDQTLDPALRITQVPNSLTQVPTLVTPNTPTTITQMPHSLTQVPTLVAPTTPTSSPSKTSPRVRTEAPVKPSTLPQTRFPTKPPNTPGLSFTSEASSRFSEQLLALMTVGITVMCL